MSACILFSNILKSFFSGCCVICKVREKPCFSSRIDCSNQKELLPNINTKESFLPKPSVDVHQICLYCQSHDKEASKFLRVFGLSFFFSHSD